MPGIPNQNIDPNLIIPSQNIMIYSLYFNCGLIKLYVVLIIILTFYVHVVLYYRQHRGNTKNQ